MSPYVPLFVQVLAEWIILDRAVALLIAETRNDFAGLGSARDSHLCAARLELASSMLCHVDLDNCAPTWSTMTSHAALMTSWTEPIKSRTDASSLSGHGSTALMMSPYVPPFVQIFAAVRNNPAKCH
ncbi:hypothetical protein HPB50_027267 [Hyalomma asiaticum]|uniref:Uncharacterized protein n=1 Tax=Hyalomma asiaticum TaxID=266040 RepID=A0ACB7STV5_HYAAI|nr:hypothetical protein HPB50_027267 [Hyalomma asiaticum]